MKALFLYDGAKRESEVAFNHRLKNQLGKYHDVSLPTDGNLRLLVGDQSDVNDHMPEMMISNVNWCYRVAFMSPGEAIQIGENAYIIKRTDIKVYQHQYDEEIGKDTLLYVCLDLLTDYIILMWTRCS